MYRPIFGGYDGLELIGSFFSPQPPDLHREFTNLHAAAPEDVIPHLFAIGIGCFQQLGIDHSIGRQLFIQLLRLGSKCVVGDKGKEQQVQYFSHLHNLTPLLSAGIARWQKTGSG